MSPTKRVGGAAELAAHTVVVDDNHLEEKSAAPLTAIEKMLVMLGDLFERWNRWRSPRESKTLRTGRARPSRGIQKSPDFGTYPS